MRERAVDVGVGQAAIQIAWRHGARVFATAGTDEKLAKARQLGAYEVVNHTTEDLPARVKDKRVKREQLAERALADLTSWRDASALSTAV